MAEKVLPRKISKPQPNVNCTCMQCGKTFFVWASGFRNGEGKYCSRACRPTLVERACRWCQKTYMIAPSVLKRGSGQCCSRACRLAYMYRTPLADRFWAHVPHRPDVGCWLWNDIRDKKRYRSLSYKNKSRPAHRLSWELHFGEIPNGLFVCHHCDTPLCVRPDHLFLGTNQENLQDAATKGRTAHGERNSRAKLTEPQVREIRRQYAQSKDGMYAIARSFSVTASCVWNIVNRYTWRHVD